MAVRKVKGGYIADVSYKGIDGKYKRARSKSPFSTKKEASNDEKRLEALYTSGEYLKNTITFETICEEWLAYRKNKVSPSTYKKIERHSRLYFIPYFNNKKIKEINFNDITKWQSFLIEKELSNIYINKLTGYLKSVFKYALACDYITKDPFYFVEPLREVSDTKYTLIDLKSYVKLQNAVKEHSKNKNDMLVYDLVFHLLMFYGLRPGELLALQINDFDQYKQELNIYKSADMKQPDGKGNNFTIGPTKTRRTRIIFLTDESTKKITDYIESLKTFDTFSNDFYFFQGIKPISYTNFTNYKNYYFDKAELPRSTFKDFRHSYTSLMYYDTDINDKDLSKSLGHSKTKITLDTYTHQIRNNTVNYIEKLQQSIE